MRKINNYNNSYNIVGNKIKKIRKKENLSQEDLCARMQVLGFQISRSDISKIETGKKLVTDFEVVGFSQALKIDIKTLFEDI